MLRHFGTFLLYVAISNSLSWFQKHYWHKKWSSRRRSRRQKNVTFNTIDKAAVPYCVLVCHKKGPEEEQCRGHWFLFEFNKMSFDWHFLWQGLVSHVNCAENGLISSKNAWKFPLLVTLIRSKLAHSRMTSLALTLLCLAYLTFLILAGNCPSKCVNHLSFYI